MKCLFKGCVFHFYAILFCFMQANYYSDIQFTCTLFLELMPNFSLIKSILTFFMSFNTSLTVNVFVFILFDIASVLL